MRYIFLVVVFFLLQLATVYGQYAEAIATRNIAQVEALIALGVDVDERIASGGTPLMAAVATNQFEIAKLLLDNGASLTPLQKRVSFQRSQRGTDHDSESQGSVVMKLAAKYASPRLVKLLIDLDAPLDDTLIELAYINRATADLPKVVSLLLEAGAYLDDTMEGYDLLGQRSAIDFFPCIEYMHDAQFNGGTADCSGQAAEVVLEALNQPSTYNLRNPESLSFVVRYGGPVLVEHMLENGADVNEVIVRTEGNRANPPVNTTPLELALINGNWGAVDVLLAYGADVSLVDPWVLSRANTQTPIEPYLEFYDIEAPDFQPVSEIQSCDVPVREKTFVSFIFDDNERRDRNVIENIFEPRGYKGTLAVVSGTIGESTHTDVEGLKEFQTLGWEIISHAIEHENHAYASERFVEESLRISQEKLASLGFQTDLFVYPFGAFTAKTKELVAKYYKAAFAGGYRLNGPNADLYELTRYNITNHHNLAEYMEILEQSIERERWLIWIIHSSYDLNIEQQKNVEVLLDSLCEKGVAVMTAGDGLNHFIDIFDSVE